MNQKFIKTMTLIIVMSFVVMCFAGCTKSKDAASSAPANSAAATTAATTAAPTAAPTASPAPANYYDMLDTVADSSDLPDWTGKQLDLKVWYASGPGGAKRPTSSNDVVTPEIKRVTGVSIDPNTSFDNGGQDAKVKLGMLTASNDWPDMLITSDLAPYNDMILNEVLGCHGHRQHDFIINEDQWK